MASAPQLGADEFENAFAEHGRSLWVLAAAWVGRGDAADLVQETARVAWQRRQEFVPGTNLRAWLAQIARHLGANWRRRLRPVGAHDLDEQPAAEPARPAWPLDADRHGLPDELARALAGLGEAARACFLLHVIQELTFAEIAAMLELSENTVASHVRRARERLRAALATPLADAPRRDRR
ncbi:MAG: RNA polymerase sigma factor [Planctomycetes bacterium]|nr:RNA polymerase sigma factor [Planctomycetota bacterium]